MTLERKTGGSIRSLARFRASVASPSSSRRSSSATSGRKQVRNDEDDVHARALELCSSEKWNELRALLSGSGAGETSASFASCSSSLDGTAATTGETTTALHAACHNHPPVDVVRMLAATFPRHVVSVDEDGRTPLHVSAARGASPPVISCLLELDDGGTGAASMRDADGKTPIVLCCEKCCFDTACDPGDYEVERKLVAGPLIEVVRALCEACPDAVNDPDDDDMTALEYAILMGATREVVKMLQRVSVKAWKAKKSKSSRLEMSGAGETGGSSASLRGPKPPQPSGRDDGVVVDESSSRLADGKSAGHRPREVGRRDSSSKGRYSFEKLQRASLRDLKLKLRSSPSTTTAATPRKNGDDDRRLSLRKKTSMPRAA